MAQLMDARLVSWKSAVAAIPGMEAFTVKLPAVLFAVRAGAAAIPLASVMTFAVGVPVPANVPLAPLAGAVNVTSMPATGAPGSYWTSTLRGSLNAVSTCVDCGEPLLTDTAGKIFLSRKLAVEVIPVREAFTVYKPDVPLAVKTGDLAMPSLPVIIVV